MATVGMRYSMVGVVWFVATIAVSHGAWAAGIEFKPFNYNDIVNPVTGNVAQSGEHLKIVANGNVLFEGLAQDLLSNLNLVEKHYCSLGQSLRIGGKLLLTETLTNPRLMYAQMMNDLQIEQEQVLDKVLPQRKDCPEIDFEFMGMHPLKLVPYLPKDKIQFDDGPPMSAEDFVERINEQQKIACAMGYSLLDGLNAGADVVNEVMHSRSLFMQDFGISKYLPRFNMEPLKKALKAGGAVAEEVGRWVEQKTKAGFESIRRATAKMGIHIPEHLSISDLPNIPTVNIPQRQDLAIKKRKEWTGLNRGERSLFNVFATAFYDIRGDETSEELTAEGKAGVVIFGHEIRALQGTIQAYGGPEEVSGRLYLQALAFNIDRRAEKRDQIISVVEPNALNYEYREGYAATFTVGPIPVGFSAGAAARVGVGWELGIRGVAATGQIGPYIAARAFVEGVVGFSGFLSAGASAALELISMTSELRGHAGLRFEDDATPVLGSELNAQVRYSMLRGGRVGVRRVSRSKMGYTPMGHKARSA